MLPFGLDKHRFQQFERRPVEPLEVVEEQRQRVLSTREHADQLSKRHLYPRLRLRRGDFTSGRLLSDDELELRNEVDQDRAVRFDGLTKLVAPYPKFGVGLDKKLTD